MIPFLSRKARTAEIANKDTRASLRQVPCYPEHAREAGGAQKPCSGSAGESVQSCPPRRHGEISG